MAQSLPSARKTDSIAGEPGSESAREHTVWGLPQGLDPACAPGMFVSYSYIHPSCAQSGPTLCDRMDRSPPGSSVHGMLQARILDWVAVSSSRDLLDPGVKPASCVVPALQVDSLLLSHRGNPRRPRSFAPPLSAGQVSLLSLHCGTRQNLRPLSSDSRALGKAGWGHGMGKLQCRK